jgi:hypothetical protein
MTTETNNAMTINMDDANLPIEGPAWEAMLEHVLANAGSGDLYEAIDAEWVKFNFDISDIYDDDEIVEYVQCNLDISDVYDDEQIMEYAGTLLHDTIIDYIWGRVKDICREENLPDHFCPVAITNELASAIKLKKENEEMREKLGKISKAGGVTYTDFLSAECCKLEKEKENLSGCVLGQQKLYDRLKAELEKEKEDRKEAHRVWTEHRHRLIEETEKLKAVLRTLRSDAKMALNGEWEVNDEGFQAQIDAIDAVVKKEEVEEE